ncbi:reverse transcriptase domain-containing protein [Tanacetum coccineum]
MKGVVGRRESTAHIYVRRVNQVGKDSSNEGLVECKASASNLRLIQVRDIVKEVKDYLKTYSSAGMNISYPKPKYEVGASSEQLAKLSLKYGRDVSKNRHAFNADILHYRILATSQLPPLRIQPPPIISGTVPPIPPPLGTNSGNTASPNRVDTILDFPQLLDSRGGSYVTLLVFDIEDFSTWKYRFLVYLNGLEPYLHEDSGSDVEEDTMSSSEFLADLNDEFHERALLVNQKRFYKRSGKVGSARKPMDKSNETGFAYGKLGKYKGLKAKIVILTKKIDVMSKDKSEKELVAGVTDAEVASQEEMASFLLHGLVCKAHAIYTSKRRAFWSLNEDILKITILKTNTPYPSRKIRRIRACTHQRPQRIKAQYAELAICIATLDLSLTRIIGIGKFVFQVDFIILDMSEDIKVPLILGRPFLSTARAKIDVYKRKITLRVGEEKIIFKSVRPASSLIRRVYMLSLRERMELDLEARLMGETLVLNRSLDPFLEDYIELNDLNEPFELRRNQGDDLMPTIEEDEVIEEFSTRDEDLDTGIDDYPSYYDSDKKIHIDCAHNLKFSCMIGFEFTHVNFFPLLYVVTDIH